MPRVLNKGSFGYAANTPVWGWVTYSGLLTALASAPPAMIGTPLQAQRMWVLDAELVWRGSGRSTWRYLDQGNIPEEACAIQVILSPRIRYCCALAGLYRFPFSTRNVVSSVPLHPALVKLLGNKWRTRWIQSVSWWKLEQISIRIRLS